MNETGSFAGLDHVSERRPSLRGSVGAAVTVEERTSRERSAKWMANIYGAERDGGRMCVSSCDNFGQGLSSRS